MAKFHINGNGEAGQCRAQAGGCPFGGEAEHFTTAEAARESFEARMGDEAHASTSKNDGKKPFRVQVYIRERGQKERKEERVVYAKDEEGAREFIAGLSTPQIIGSVQEITEDDHKDLQKGEKPVYEAVRADGSRGFTVTYSGALGGGTRTKTVYAKTASEARKSVAKTLPHLGKITEVKRKLAPTPEESAAYHKSAVDEIRSVALQTRIDEELANTEFGAQFRSGSFQASMDGRTLTGVVEEPFSYQGRHYEEGAKLRLSSSFDISHTISEYSDEPESLARRRLFQESPKVQQEINRVARNHGEAVADDVYSLMKDVRTVAELRNRAGDLKLQSDKYGSENYHEFNAARDGAEAKAKELEAKGYPWQNVMDSYTTVGSISELTSAVLRNRK